MLVFDNNLKSLREHLYRRCQVASWELLIVQNICIFIEHNKSEIIIIQIKKLTPQEQIWHYMKHFILKTW